MSDCNATLTTVIVTDEHRLAPWQRDIMDALERGERVTVHQARWSGKRRLMRAMCVSAELHGVRWDIVSPNAPQWRREAREEAAAIADVLAPLRAPEDDT